ncbi:DNA ligase [Marinomonas sp. 2405UD68-3]|uniref:DNA ligase n=1 Tax=Marinomonas sp. 2405UD68-3 TaxID=3391835 RepID=UPI0039C92097
MNHIKVVFACLYFFFCQCVFASNQPQVQLAKIYSDDLLVSDYLVSEKYDGIRAIWKGGQLLTKSGRQIMAPVWFTEKLPANVWLDGELWSGRQEFEFIQSTVLSLTPNDEHWKRIRYKVFDAPNQTQPFYQRVHVYTELVNRIAVNHLHSVKQQSLVSRAALMTMLEMYVGQGAEGLILHKKDALFRDGRSDSLVKLKPYMDAEAHVIGYIAGKGRNLGKMGSLIVKTEFGVVFKIGSGFTDAERDNPPEIGDIITFKYHGVTKNAVPKFASFLRMRDVE